MTRFSLIGDAAGYVLERVVGLALGAVAAVLVARYLGPSDYGLLSYVTGLFALVAPISLLGMPSIIVRDLSTRDVWRPVIASALLRQTPAALVGCLVGVLVAMSTRPLESRTVLLSLALAPTPLLALSATVRARLEVTSSVRRVVVAGFFAALAGSGMKIIASLVEAPIWVFGLAVTVEGAILFAAYLGVRVRGRLSALRSHYNSEIARRLMKEGWPLLIAGMAVMVYVRADVVMLGIMAGDSETGIYSAAARLSEVWYFAPVAAMAAFRPQLARLHAGADLAHYAKSTQKLMTLAVAAAWIVVLAIVFGAEHVIRLLYGGEFDASSQVLRLHIFAAPFVFLGVSASQWFIDHGLTRAVMMRSVTGAVLNVILNLLLIPSYGAIGAATATLVAYSSGIWLNGLSSQSRPLFKMQLRALRLYWPSGND